MEYLNAELSRQIEAYNQSLVNDEILEVRKSIAIRIVAIEKVLINLKAIPMTYHASINTYLYQ